MDHFIYLDYNATTPVDKEVVEAMLPYLESGFGNPSSPYLPGVEAQQAMDKARLQVASLINANSDEIIFTSGGTESNNLAIQGVAFANKSRGKHIITTQIEHPAVINVCKYLESIGWEITYLPVNRIGMIESADLEKAIRPDTVLVSIMHANNEVGTIQPIEEIGEITKRHKVLFHTDAAQSIGKEHVDVAKAHVDLLTIAGHKMYAPKGIGALYVRQGVKLDTIMKGAGQERGIRPGTENIPYIVGLGQAAAICQRDMKQNINHQKELKVLLYNILKKSFEDKVSLNGHLEYSLPNTLSMAFEGVDAHALAAQLSSKLGISTGSACHANKVHVSSVLQAMRITPESALSTIRISVGKYTSIDEINQAVELIGDSIKVLQVENNQ